MKKFKYLFTFLFIVAFTINVKAIDINLDSKYAIIYNLNEEEVIFEKNPDTKIAIASLTKIMTSIIAIEKFPNLEEKAMVPYGTNDGLIEQNAARVGFVEGTYVTYNDLIHGALLPSGADATRAIAILISGSEENFAVLMNEKAKNLGMKNTHFVNSSGLDADNHYSTVEDVLILLKYALKNPTFKKIYETKNYTSSDYNFYMQSTVVQAGKRFNIDVSYIKGSKTGYTFDAGHCLASELVIEDTTFLSVTAGSDVNSNTSHLLDASTIYNYIKNNYSMRSLVEKNTKALTLYPKYAKTDSVSFYTDKTIKRFLLNDLNIDTKFVYHGTYELFGNEKKGTHLGSIEVIYNGEVIDTIDVTLNEDLKFDFFKLIKHYFYVIPILIGLILIIIWIIKKKKRKK